jgi:hypothetical protein
MHEWCLNNILQISLEMTITVSWLCESTSNPVAAAYDIGSLLYSSKSLQNELSQTFSLLNARRFDKAYMNVSTTQPQPAVCFHQDHGMQLLAAPAPSFLPPPRQERGLERKLPFSKNPQSKIQKSLPDQAHDPPCHLKCALRKMQQQGQLVPYYFWKQLVRRHLA